MLQLSVDALNIVDALSQRLLHQDEAVGEPSYTIATGTLGQRLVKVAGSYTLCLTVELIQRLHCTADSLVAEKHQEQQSDTDDSPGDNEQAVISCEDIVRRANDGNAPACALQRTVEDEGIVAVNDGLRHTAVAGKHRLAHSIDISLGLGGGVTEDIFAEKLCCIGMYEVGAISPYHNGR